jgi:RNA polymerase sigma factor (sigma-70 family)
VGHQLERLFGSGTATGLTEGQLLDRFASGRDESAFEALVERHGPMVLGVCRQLLRDPNDVDDAFQATFLVLVRKAGSLRQQELLGNWLYGVAYRVALRGRFGRGRAKCQADWHVEDQDLGDDSRCERSETLAESVVRTEQYPLIHEEVNRLPLKYRSPVVLCYFEGLTTTRPR